jgi:hypothetical protein
MRRAKKLNAEGVRIALPEGMPLYPLFTFTMWIQCPFSPLRHSVSDSCERHPMKAEEPLSRRLSQIRYCRRRSKA